MTPDQILMRARDLGRKNPKLRERMAVNWVEVHTAIGAQAHKAWPPISDQRLMAQYNMARLAMMTAIVEGREADAKTDGYRAAGLEAPA